MKLTREHKILLGVLGAGLLALGVDRFVLGGATEPQSAAAEDYAVTPEPSTSHTHDSTPAVTPTVQATAPTVAPAAPTGPVIAQSLRDTRQRHAGLFNGSRDAFVLLPGWLSPPTNAKPTAQPERLGEKVASFLQKNKLLALMNNDIAIINDKTYRVGDTIDGASLVAIDRTSATLRIGETTFVMMLVQPPKP